MFNYYARVLRVVDGDTLDLEVDLGFRTLHRCRVRLFGIDTPETYGVKKGSPEWVAGMAAKDFVLEWLGAIAKDDGGDLVHEVEITSHDAKPLGVGKYGRWLALVKPRDGGHAPSLNDLLVSAGHAVYRTYK